MLHFFPKDLVERWRKVPKPGGNLCLHCLFVILVFAPRGCTMEANPPEVGLPVLSDSYHATLHIRTDLGIVCMCSTQ